MISVREHWTVGVQPRAVGASVGTRTHCPAMPPIGAAAVTHGICQHDRVAGPGLKGFTFPSRRRNDCRIRLSVLPGLKFHSRRGRVSDAGKTAGAAAGCGSGVSL